MKTGKSYESTNPTPGTTPPKPGTKEFNQYNRFQAIIDTGKIVDPKKIDKVKDAKYYIKDGIKCTKRDMKQNLREIRYQVGDLIAGYWDLITLRFKKQRKGDKNNG